MKKLIMTAFVLGAVAGVSQATLYKYEGYDYAAGSALGAQTGYATAGSGGAPTNRAASLAYSGLPASTGGKVQSYGQRPASSRSINYMIWTNGVPNGETQTNLFASFILNVASVGTIQSNQHIFALRNGTCQIMITNNASNPGKYNIGLFQQVGKTVWAWDTNNGNGYDVNTSYLVAVSYTNTTASTYNSQVWINPVLGNSSPGTANMGIAMIYNSSSSSYFSLSNGNGNPASGSEIYVDELRVGSTWADVTPAAAAPGVCKLVFDNATPSQFSQKPSVTTNLSFVVRNDGSDASNVTVSLTANYSWLTIDTTTNSFALIIGGGAATNFFNVTIASNAPGGTYANAFTLNMQGAGTDGIVSNFSAQISLQVLNTVFSSISKTTFLANTNGTDTAILTVSNTSAEVLSFVLSNAPVATWLSYPSGTLTLPAYTATNIVVAVDGSLATGYGSYSNTLSVQYLNNFSTPNPANFLLSFEVSPPVSRLVNLFGNFNTGTGHAYYVMPTLTTNGETLVYDNDFGTAIVTNGAISTGGSYTGPTIYGSFRHGVTGGTAGAPPLPPYITRIENSDKINFNTRNTNTVGEIDLAATVDMMFVFKKADFGSGFNTGSVTFDSASAFVVTTTTWSANSKSMRAVVQNGSIWYISQDQSTNNAGIHTIVTNASAARWAVWDPLTSIDISMVPDFSSTVAGSTFADIQAVGIYGHLTRDSGANGTLAAGISAILIGDVVATNSGVRYAVTASAVGNGTVSPANANVPAGSSQNFVITASNYYRIASLTTNGTVVSGMTFDNDSISTNFLWSNVQAAGALVATFASQVAGDPAGTPYSWLASYGLTNGGTTFDQAAVADHDLDGLQAWQEYIAGTDPTDSADYLKVFQNTRNVISWRAVAGRIYSVLWSTNLVSGFQPLNTNILYPQSSYTNETPGASANYYQVKVRLE